MKLSIDSGNSLAFFLVPVLLALISARGAFSQTADNSLIAARVDGFEIREVRVEAYLQRTVPGWPLAKEQQPPARAAAAEHLIKRQLVLASLRLAGLGSTPTELEWKRDELRAQLQRVGKTLNDHLDASNLSEEELRNDMDWELAWKKYLARTLTAERLEQEYRAHSRDFDGTELHVAQILLPAEPAKAQTDGLARAEQLAQRLRRGELDWNSAVRGHSISPSRERDGDLGWIRRQEPMPEEFSRTAFALIEGEISAPLASKFGVHLIKCLEVRPGKLQFGDVRDEVYRVVMEAEFRRLAAEMRPKVDVWVRPRN